MLTLNSIWLLYPMQNDLLVLGSLVLNSFSSKLVKIIREHNGPEVTKFVWAIVPIDQFFDLEKPQKLQEGEFRSHFETIIWKIATSFGDL